MNSAAPNISQTGGAQAPPRRANGFTASRVLSNMDIAALAELRTHTQWVAWRHKEIVKADGTKKLTKPPVSPIHGGGASHSKPADWGTFDQARVFAMSRKMAGVGFVLAEGDGYTGIDLDKCRDPATGEIEPWARAILDLAETYAEISPSGTGIRLIARGKVEHATKSDPAHVEIYGKQRYLTITGDHVAGAPDDIREAPQTIAALKARAAEHQSAAEARARAAQPEAKPAAPAKEPLDFFGGRDRKATPRPDAPKAKKPKRENDFFRGVNDAAMCDPGWFLNIFPRAKWYPGSGDYRVSSVDLGRSLEEDISFKLGSSGGIVDFGVHDMGDARRGRRTPVDVVIEHGGAPDAKAAAFWLCERLGRTPEDFGWGERAPEPANDHQPHDASAEPRAGAERANDASPNRGAAKPPLIQATPYSWPDPASIPVREWLYGRHLIRRFVSTTIAPGGVGKSSLTIAEAVSMICGRPLLHGVKPASALNVWLVNLEDPLEEIERRVAATMKHYGLRREDCPGHLYVNSGRDCELVVAKMTRGEMEVHRPLVDAVKATIAANQIDALIIDPFVRSHRLPENSNEAIDLAVSEWAKIADEASCAVDLVHHARKTGGMEVTVEDGRGASAMISATRSARALNQMTQDEASRSGVENRRLYFRTTNGKANMSPAPESSNWFQMKSVDLGNGSMTVLGDEIGVVAEWKWPDPLDDVDVADLEAVKRIVASGQWRENVQAKDWVGRAVAEALDLDATDIRHKDKIRGLLKVWMKNKVFVVVRRPDANGDERPYVEVNPDTS